ncbi:LOW QUALITY PROTEIN: golgin subfamily A member 6-like protein 1 [Drosophila eugracilis]|uniref:LOW QUALITY PROTEIN: golgin subfamily A member 6-like protein 1 n=1 Tax=Drosophila eugracilis TaxID=29029 RepID=UPI0007E7BC8B|nr:LOW QUALITY PROTEIN: golgin subfamily A member 6-like protein 1 [Drosophila eugracilis]
MSLTAVKADAAGIGVVGGGGTVALSDSREWAPPPPGNRCATVTMLLAQRIARNACWSVDEEPSYSANKMNVWQTLEYLSGLSLRKKYNYEGFSDTHNVIRTLTPSWRRDSFAEKAKAEELTGGAAASSVKYPEERSSSAPLIVAEDPGISTSFQSSDNVTLGVRSGAKSPSGTRRKLRRNRKGNATHLDPEYALSPEDLQDLVKCNFNLPRISARLERLMGTNVVKLTDRAYMKELRERIDEDYRKQLLSRIRARELKEVERERMLIIEGKSDVIPDELADDPIFMVNKDANMEIQKERSKLKTAREKNAERLKQQGVKWERERLQHAAKEAELLAKKRERHRQQKLLVEQYRTEDAERGMDLLRIDNEDWRECEKSLKEFLEQERAKMKERSLRISQPFSSDPQDIQNIVRARQKFRETELRIRNQLDDKLKDVKLAVTTQQLTELIEDAHRSSVEIVREPSIDEDHYQGEIQSRYQDDVTDVSEETVISEDAISLSLAKQQYAEELEAEMEDEFNRGLLISKQQYDQLRFEDEKIVALRNAKDIRELYQLAEEIIMGEIFEEAAEEYEEEAVGEEQDLEITSDHEALQPAAKA